MPVGVKKQLPGNLKDGDYYLTQKVRELARDDFEFFYNNIFSISIREIEGEFVPGNWLNGFCRRLQKFIKTVTGAARKHGKTTVVLGFVAWLLFRCDSNAGKVAEYLYIMYSDDLACEKVKKCKQYIQANPYFNHIVDLKPTAESIMEYRVGDHIFILKPAGIYSFSRGKHPDGVICDDILKDPEKKLDLEQIKKITEIFQKVVTALPKEGGFLHLVGTSQDKSDIFHILKKLKMNERGEGWNYAWHIAIIDRRKKIVLWPEMFPFIRLIDIEINETGKKNFRREYQLDPVRSVEGYFSESEIENLIDRELTNYGIIPKSSDNGVEFEETFGGYDIGKKRHPAHIAIFQVVTEKKIDYLIQICSIWMDGMDYNDQVEICKTAIRRFGIVLFPYDNTRGELESLQERGELPGEMKPFVFGSKSQQKVAVDMEKLINQGRLILLNDDRQKSQILSVDNNLDAPETAEGHGESFWSVGLAVQGYLDGSVSMLSVG